MTTYGPSGVGDSVGEEVSVGATVALGALVSEARTIATGSSVAAVVLVTADAVSVTGGADPIPCSNALPSTNPPARQAITTRPAPIINRERREAGGLLAGSLATGVGIGTGTGTGCGPVFLTAVEFASSGEAMA